jgi:hypothetical protein
VCDLTLLPDDCSLVRDSNAGDVQNADDMAVCVTWQFVCTFWAVWYANECSFWAESDSRVVLVTSISTPGFQRKQDVFEDAPLGQSVECETIKTRHGILRFYRNLGRGQPFSC